MDCFNHYFNFVTFRKDFVIITIIIIAVIIIEDFRK